MTSTIPGKRRKRARHVKPTKSKRARFSSMESLGFTYSPLTASNTWTTERPPSRPTTPPPQSQPAEPATSDTLADWEPNRDTTAIFLQRRVRWGMLTTVALIIVALTATGIWLWQRPEAVAEAALGDISAQAEALEPELTSLQEINQGLVDADVDANAISTQSLTVDSEARALFDASGALPSSRASIRRIAADVATTSLDASRLISDAASYRAAVLPILATPELETDPELIELDEAVRSFGEWQSRFDEVRRALPSTTMSAVSDQLQLISGNLEPIQRDYLDGLRADDRLAAQQALDDLGDQLSEAESVLGVELVSVQERVNVLIDDSLSGINQLTG